MTTYRLNDREAHAFARLMVRDGLAPADYEVVEGVLSHHIFADNRTSMVYDLTLDRNVDADSIAEADQITEARRHQPWCPTKTGHDGDCWMENNRVLGIGPEPAIVIVDATTGRREEVW